MLLLLLGSGRVGYAQPTPRGGLVQGLVRDSVAGQPLRAASVSLLLARDSSYVTFALTDSSGHYALRSPRLGRYLVQVHALGYEPLQLPVETTAARPAVALPPLHPRPAAQQLAEVVVAHERPPVSISGDTVSFSARSFKTQPNASTEQLLRKLPGLEVDRDGNLRAQGQPVARLLVDGKPFFGGDPKMATRNLPAAIINQVQVYDQQSDQANFSGIDSGERQRTLNLVTRRDKRRGYFGTEQVGGGTNGRYQARLGLNRFNNGRQLSALAQADNGNQQGFTDDGNPAAARPGTTVGAGSLPGASTGPALATPGGLPPASSSPGGSGAGITESASGGLNYRDAWGQRLEVAASYLATRATTRNDQQLRRQNLTGDPAGAVPITDQLTPGRLRTATQRASLHLDARLDSLTSLRLTPRLSWQATDQLRTADQQTSVGGRLLNQSRSRYAAQADNLTGGGETLLMRKFRQLGRTFSASLGLNIVQQGGQVLNQATNTFYPAAGVGAAQVIDQQLTQRTPARSSVLSLAYTEPFGLRHKLEAHYSYTLAPSQAQRLTQDYNAATGQYDQYDALLSNEFSSRYAAQRVGLTWQTHRLRYTYNLGLDAQQATLGLANQTAETSLRRAYPSLLPAATFSYTGAGSRTLRLGYRTALTAPTALQLQPVPDNSNPLSLRLGNPDLRPEYAHSLTATYNQFDPARGRSVMGLLAGSVVQHRIASATTFDGAGVRTTQPINANGSWQLAGYLALGQRLATAQLNLNASTSATLNRNPSFVNGQLNVARSWSLAQTLSANSAYSERLELGLYATFTYQQAAYSLAGSPRAGSFTQLISGDAYWRPGGRWVVSSEALFTSTAGLATGYNQRVLLWNAGLAYQVLASRRGELKLYAFDLLNQNRSLVRTTTDTYVEDVRSQVLPRYLLLSFTYQVRSFGR